MTDAQSYEPPALLRATPSGDHSHSLKDAVPLSQLVHDSVMACDVDVRAALLQNIVVVGNTSLTRGLTERLDVELAQLLPSVSLLRPPCPGSDRDGSRGMPRAMAPMRSHLEWSCKVEHLHLCAERSSCIRLVAIPPTA